MPRFPSFFLTCLLVLPLAGRGADGTTFVARMGNTIVYRGDITAQANQRVAELLQQPGVRVLKITSPGGDIERGMDLGELVHAHRLVVRVDGFCNSSCANYVFAAAPVKVLDAHALVGWHGGATQDFAPSFKTDAEREQFERYIAQARAREASFFERIGVQQASTTWGQRPPYAKHRKRCTGWTYDLAAMERLGLNGVVVLGGAWAPPDRWKGRCVFKVRGNDMAHAQ